MLRACFARASLAVALAAFVGACTDADSPAAPPGQGDGGGGTIPADSASADATSAAPDAGNGPTSLAAACLDRPGELPRPPTGALPCELLPPGFGR